MESVTQRLKEQAFQLGFAFVGVVEAEPGRRLEAYLRWIAAGRHGEMAYMARPDRVRRRQNLSEVLPGVQSLVCVGLEYHAGSIPPEITLDPGRGRISSYAWGIDYHELMVPRLQILARWLQKAVNQPVATKVYVDTGAILERDHAEAAGIGFTGKNTMLIAPRRGSWSFLGELLTTYRLEPDEARQLPGCGRCRRCLDACPTGAFPTPYVLDARLCISYLTIELKDWIPRDLRPAMGNWIFGCDVCQEVCPFNRFAEPNDEAAFYPASWDRAAPPLPGLLALTEEDFQGRYAHTPIQRIGRRGLLRNACVAAGNWGSQVAVPALAGLLSDPEPILRGHAAWALRRIGGRDAANPVSAALARESDEMVRQEMLAPVTP
jgi:epoxyqueuosine reductase